MDPIDGNEPERRIPRWAALLAAAVLLTPLGFYVASLREDQSGDPTTSFPASSPTADDPFDRPGNVFDCPAAVDLNPVEAGTLDDQIDQVEDAVEQLRELDTNKRVPVHLLSPSEVKEQLEQDEFEGVSAREMERDTAILEMLGVVPEGTDLEKLGEQLSGQIVGYYDPDEKELFVNAESEDEPLPPAGETTLAHELEHALADEAFGLPIVIDAPPAKTDAALAKRALVEGDATLLTRHYAFSVLSSEQLADLQDDPTTKRALKDIDEVPPAIQLLFEFPYTGGLSFVCDLYGEGGWDAVDDAYRRLPTTTAQVMFPERYRHHEAAVEVRAIGEPGDPWTRLGGTAIGASDLFALFSAPGGETSRALDDPTTAAAGWAGGSVEVWSKGRQRALGLALEEREPADDLCTSVNAWYRVAFPDEETAQGKNGEVMAVTGSARDAVLTCDGSEVRLGIGPSLQVARSLID